MKRNLPTARQFGQSSLTSCFISSKSRSPSEATESKAPKKSISLSDFLNRKIVKTNAKSIKKKQSSFLSIGSDKNESGSGRDGGGKSRARSYQLGLIRTSRGVEETAVKRFNEPLMKEGGEVGELQSDVDAKDSARRKSAVGVSSGEDEKPQEKKYLVVLGDDPKPKPKPRTRAKRLPHERPKPFYNHCKLLLSVEFVVGAAQKNRRNVSAVVVRSARLSSLLFADDEGFTISDENGRGWWDEDREGVDSEEVGCNDVWEGMGSTTLGGLEWH
ncbi:uncharacterized protein LOC109826931 [Asparagus officinalis]|uniref:uncharacterized protein LOC109826931 n=1 Tax=Asparagus officinalis TaxID=4686 RepID=UPI00098DF95A|nr:uncharacterized protein LOC109826931 [Asparagus officinalis]